MADITCPISSSQRVVSATILSGSSVSLQVSQSLRQVAMTMQSGARNGIIALVVGTSSMVSPQTLAFANSNGVTFGLSGSTITASAVGGSGGSGEALTFANSNGVSMGVQDGVVTASVRTDYLTTAALSGHSHGDPVLALTNLSGTTGSNSDGLTISLSAAAGGGGADGYNILAAGTQTATTAGSVVFANSNGLTFGMSGSSQITASHNALTTAAQSGHSHGVTLNLTNLSGTTGGNSAGVTISLSASAPPGQSVQPVAASGSNGSFSFSTLSMGNSNGLSFYTTNGSLVGSYTVPTVPGQTVQTQNMVSILGSTGAVSFANSNGITFGGNASTVTASHNGITTAAQSNHSHGVTLNLTNLSGTTGGNSAGVTISLSASSPPAQTVQPVAASAANGSFNFSTLTFANSNGLSFSTGTQGVYGTVATNYAATNVTTANIATSQSSLFQHTSATSAITSAAMNTSERGNYFATAGNTFANSTHSHGNPTLALTNINGTTASASNGMTMSLSAVVPAQSVQTQGMVSLNGSTGGMSLVAASSLSLSQNASTISFGLASNITTALQSAGAYLTTGAQSNHSHGNPSLVLTNISGTTASNSAGLTISLSAAAPGGGAAIMISAGTTSGNVQTLVFSNGNGVSFGLNGSTVTASAAAGGGGGLNRNMIEIIQGERMTTIANLSASQWSRRPIFVPFWMDGQSLVPSTVRLIVSGVGSSNRSLVATFGVALYSKANDTQLTLFTSDSQAISITESSQSSVWNGIKLMDFTRMSDVTMTQEGRWVLATSLSASSHNATYCNVLLYGADNMPAFAGFIMGGTTSAANATSNVFPFWGVYSATTGGFPNTVAMTQIQGGSSASLLDPYCIIKEV